MTNKQMDEKIRDAFEAATPNVLGSILAQCAKQKRNITVFKQRRSIGWTRRFITVSAATILILVLVTGLIGRLPPIMPTGPLFTGTDPTGTNPTQPDALTWVDWGMNATWVLKNGTTQGQYPMQIKGLIENKKETRLKLEIYTPDSFGYQFTLPDDGYTPNALAGLVEHPGDYYDSSSTYSIKANKFVETHWAISTTKEYFIAYWPENPGLFLVGAGDPNVSAAEVMAYFDAFVEEFRTEEPKPTDPEPTDPEPTDPKPIDPNEFPDDLITDEKVLQMFREMFSYTYPEQSFFNMALLSFYDNPHEVGFEDLFYNGFAGQRPITTAEMAELRNKGFNVELDIQRLTKEQIDYVLREVFGLWEAAVDAELGRQLTYLESTDCFYTNHTDGNLAANFLPVGIQVYPNCTRVYYVYNDDTKGVVTMYKYGAAWRIHSNHILGTEPAINTVFPEGLDSSDATLEKFQTMFSFGSWNSQALCCSYSDPRDLELYNFFYGLEFEDEPPLTQAERDAIVAMSGYEDYSWLDGARFPVEKMDAKLQEMFGVSLNEMHKDAFSLMYYLENTNSYYYFNGGFGPVDFLRIIGTKTLENGYVQVYYGVGFGYHLDYLDQGVVTLKPVGDGYQVVSNYYCEDGTWPGYQPPEPTEPDAIPDKLSTDPVFLRQMQALFGTVKQNNYFNPALCSEYDDARYAKLAALLYAGNDSYGPTIEEGEELMGYGWDPEYDTYAFTTDEINDVVMEVFGITVWDMDESAWQYFWYTKCSGRYFLSYNLTLYFEDFQAIGFRTMDNGNTEVYYSGDFPAKFGVVTVKPVGNSYQIVSNKWLA